jgi:hypothetical protein
MTRLLCLAFLFVLGILLASFPTRNTDIWQQLSNGRNLLQSGVWSWSWLYDLGIYLCYSVAGGPGITASNALLVGTLAVLIFLLSGGSRNWPIPMVCTTLAILSIGWRILPQPQTASYLLLAISIWFWNRRKQLAVTSRFNWVGLVLVFAAWSFVHQSIALGLLIFLLLAVGARLDRNSSIQSNRGPFVGAILLLVVVFAVLFVNTVFRQSVKEPTELPILQSPFSRLFFLQFRESPAALAFYVTLLLCVATFALNRSTWRWERALPCLVLALLASLQSRLIPYFAIIAGPIMSWNLLEWLSRRAEARGTLNLAAKPSRLAPLFYVVLAVSFLACAWTGWLQGRPYGPRHWGTDWPKGVEVASQTLASWHESGTIPTGSKTLHLSSDTSSGFAWYCPQDSGIFDPALSQKVGLLGEGFEARLRDKQIRRVVVSVSDRRLTAGIVERLLEDPVQWPLQSVAGGVAIFSWNDPQQPRPAMTQTVDTLGLAYQPRPTERCPADGPVARNPSWSDPFIRRIPNIRSADRDEANLLMLLADARKNTAPLEHTFRWTSAQSLGMVGSQSSFSRLAALVDLTWRGSLLPPANPVSESNPPTPSVRLANEFYGQYVQDAGEIPPEIFYIAIRNARRAILNNPEDGSAYFTLGQCYTRLLNETVERSWARRFPQLARLREIQASGAYANAVQFSPRSAPVRLAFARHLQQLGCHDLATRELRVYRDLIQQAGGSSANTAEALGPIHKEIDRLTRAVDEQTTAFQNESARSSVADRALQAVQRGLASRSLEILLASDFSAFGVPGMKLELDLLLRTGRATSVRNWADGSPEWQGSLGPEAYYWIVAQAAATEGNYKIALDRLGEMVSGDAGLLIDRKTVIAGLAQIAGKSILSESFDVSNWSHATYLAISRESFGTGTTQAITTLSRQSDIVTLRGLLALEAGDIASAEAAFEQVVGYLNDEYFDFKARPIAVAGKSRIHAARQSASGRK